MVIRDEVGNAEVAARCLVRVGVAPAGFTGANLDELQKQYPRVTLNLEEEIAACNLIELDHGAYMSDMVPVEVGDELFVPGGKSLDSPEAVKCFMNPQR